MISPYLPRGTMRHAQGIWGGYSPVRQVCWAPDDEVKQVVHSFSGARPLDTFVFPERTSLESHKPRLSQARQEAALQWASMAVPSLPCKSTLCPEMVASAWEP